MQKILIVLFSLTLQTLAAQEVSVEYDKFKEDNPKMERYFDVEGLAGLGDGARMSTPGAGQPDKAFEHGVIERIKQTVPGNTLGKTHKTKLPREW